jgi:hypothetical protein
MSEDSPVLDRYSDPLKDFRSPELFMARRRPLVREARKPAGKKTGGVGDRRRPIPCGAFRTHIARTRT